MTFIERLTDWRPSSPVTAIWLFFFGIAFSTSLAALNILLGIGVAGALSLKTFRKKLACITREYVFSSLILCTFILVMEMIHDGILLPGKAGSVAAYLGAIIVGCAIRMTEKQWAPILFIGLIAGIVLGAVLKSIMDPQYPFLALYGGLGYANQAATFVLMVSFLSFVLTRNHFFPLIWLLGALWFATEAGERAVLPELVFALLAVTFGRKHQRAVIGVIILTLLLPIIYYLVMAYTGFSNTIQSVRPDLWHLGIEISSRDNLIGRGLIQDYSKADVSMLDKFVPVTKYGPLYLHDILQPGTNIAFHNQFIQFLVEYGVSGCLLFLLFSIQPIKELMKRRVDRGYSVFLAIWTVYFVHLQVENGFTNHFAIFIGFLVGLLAIRGYAPSN